MPTTEIPYIPAKRPLYSRIILKCNTKKTGMTVPSSQYDEQKNSIPKDPTPEE